MDQNIDISDNLYDNGIIDIENSKEENDVENEEKCNKQYYCYILQNSYHSHKKRTYNGFTVNPKRRIRQHNQEIKGGARYTKKFGNKSWEIYVLVTGFPNNVNALQCEWRIKHPDNRRKRPAKYNSPEGRIKGLCEVLQLDRWTSQSDINNSDSEFTVWIKRGFENLLCDLPNNIKVNVVDKIDLDNLA